MDRARFHLALKRGDPLGLESALAAVPESEREDVINAKDYVGLSPVGIAVLLNHPTCLDF